jgi:hypothetical protein
VRGALIAGLIASDGFVVKITNELLDATPLEIGKWQVVLTAIGLVATVVTNPNGLAGMGTGRALSLRRLRSA